MITALFCISEHGLDIGFTGDYEPQSRVDLPIDSYVNKPSLQQALLESIRKLLVTSEALTVIIVEPPLFNIQFKQLIAEILLLEYHCQGVGFMQRSVCCVVGNQKLNGILIDNVEKLAVPVYDCRELTPQICGLEEYSQQETIERVLGKAAIDTRKELRSNVIEYSGHKTWLGASALASRQTVWPIITKEKLKRNKRVWDSLYDMK